MVALDPNRRVVTEMWHGQPRVRLATLPTHLERGPVLAGQSGMWVKRDDLTGLGMGGNKARKLEFLCGAAVAAGADCIITVGAGQSNHCRMTAAAGAVLGLEVHLVLAGDRPKVLEGNQLLSERFGAHQHFTGAGPSEWGLLEIAREDLTEELSAQGLKPYSIPIGGSTAVGALGYIVAYQEIVEQAQALKISPKTIVFTSSSGGTHAGLVAGRAYLRALGTTDVLPNLLAIGVAKGVVAGFPSVKELAQEALTIAGLPGEVVDEDVEVDARWLGDDYAIATAASRDAITWAAHNGAWVLDDVYTAKGMAGLLGNANQGRWGSGDDVIFIHTGGSPEVFVRHD
jgi:1-aminocyclopropane-1-carboxylate deaminase/D-cysteine desulfhydrase-like pyridoxal-dependent ACC family enzyme